MKKYLMALALASLMSGCLAMPLSTPLQGGTICLTPEFAAGGYSTQAVVSKYAQASINHLQIDLYNGVTLIASKDILNAALGNTVTINNLRSDTTYTIKASAYKAAGVAAADLISIPADSQVQVTVAFDDRPTLAGIPVKLIDTPFGGQATGSIIVTPSANFTTPATESFPFIISTFAGDGTYGFSGDGLAATSAQLKYPEAVAFDGAGNLYIADFSQNRVRKVTPGGVITTFAGDGTAVYGGDGLAATSAQLCHPRGLACDSAGNLYISDNGNHRIRKVDKDTQVITTVAGDGTEDYGGDGLAATDAQLRWPRGLACDSVGNLYISDFSNNRIRKVDKDTQVITTVAGCGGGTTGDGGPATAAKFSGPAAVAFDSAGNLYIADSGNARIRKVDKDTQVITTVAGTGTAGYDVAEDGGLATNAKLNGPRGLAFDSAGNLYISDADNNRIRKVDKDTQVITTVAGDGTAAYGGDGGDAPAAQLNYPVGLVFDSADNLYIGDADNSRIRKVCF